MSELRSNVYGEGENVSLEPVTALPIEVAERKPWGFWATVAWGLLGAFVYFGGALVVALLFVVVAVIQQPNFKEDELVALAEGLESDGLFLSVGTLASGIPLVGLVVLLAWARTGQIGAYLGFRRPTWGTVLRWCGLMAVLMVLIEGVTILAGVESVPEVMRSCYRSAGSLPLFYFVIVMGAPFFEEIFFRGFLFEGFSRSRFGGWPTVVATAALWAGIHLQYEMFIIGMIFVMGLVLGAARLKTGSTWLTMLLHGVCNLVATVQTAWVVGMEG